MYSIRKAVPDDLKQLLEFEQKLIETERPMDPTIRDGKISYYDIAAFIESDDTEVIVAEYRGKIVASGYASLKDDRHYLKHAKKGHLGFMYVSEAHRGKGLNQRIIGSLISWCKEQGVYEIRLDVYQDNPQAVKAYEKSGFKKHLITMRLDATDL